MRLWGPQILPARDYDALNETPIWGGAMVFTSASIRWRRFLLSRSSRLRGFHTLRACISKYFARPGLNPNIGIDADKTHVLSNPSKLYHLQGKRLKDEHLDDFGGMLMRHVTDPATLK